MEKIKWVKNKHNWMFWTVVKYSSEDKKKREKKSHIINNLNVKSP